MEKNINQKIYTNTTNNMPSCTINISVYESLDSLSPKLNSSINYESDMEKEKIVIPINEITTNSNTTETTPLIRENISKDENKELGCFQTFLKFSSRYVRYISFLVILKYVFLSLFLCSDGCSSDEITYIIVGGLVAYTIIVTLLFFWLKKTECLGKKKKEEHININQNKESLFTSIYTV